MIKLRADKICEELMTFEISIESLCKQLKGYVKDKDNLKYF